MLREQWFPAVESKNVVGRFDDTEEVDWAKSREEDREVTRMVPVLLAKIVGSVDISVQAVKPFNEKELRKRFPGAWEKYQADKAAAAKGGEAALPFEPTIKGTPLNKADFLPQDRIEWLMLQGIQTIEQIRDLTDAQVQTMGNRVGGWRKAAKSFLERT